MTRINFFEQKHLSTRYSSTEGKYPYFRNVLDCICTYRVIQEDTLIILESGSISHGKKEKGSYKCVSNWMVKYPTFFVGFDNRSISPKKSGYTRRFAHSQFGHCCPHKERRM